MWFRRFVHRRFITFERKADYPWQNPGAKWSGAWMSALREGVYWKQISIRQIRREIAIGHVSPAIFESMQRIDPPQPPTPRTSMGIGPGKG